MHVAGDPPAPHLGDELQGLAQLLVAPALADHGGVRVDVAQLGQVVSLGQRAQPVKQLCRPACRPGWVCMSSTGTTGLLVRWTSPPSAGGCQAYDELCTHAQARAQLVSVYCAACTVMLVDSDHF